MKQLSAIVTGDGELVQIVDAALADTGRRSGDWLVCRPGCAQCCIGAFAISQLDALRLRNGLRALEKLDPDRGHRVKARAAAAVDKLGAEFPGDPRTGILHETPEAEARFAEFANDEFCPVLDPLTGTCDLYSARPMTCRVFGPAVRSEGGLGVCELCYHGATADQIASCEMVPDPNDIETILTRQLEEATGTHGQTIIAFCLNE